MSNRRNAENLYEMIGQGQVLDAFEKFYHEDVVMIEATGETRNGKNANREYEQQWMNNVQEMHGGGVNSITANEESEVTMVESWMDVSFKDGNRMKLEQVAVQNWNNGQIVKERFYYNLPGQ